MKSRGPSMITWLLWRGHKARMGILYNPAARGGSVYFISGGSKTWCAAAHVVDMMA